MTRLRDERGSLSVELAMLAPGMLLIFALIFAYGQKGQIHGTLDSGTRDGARSATASRTYDEAVQRARAAVSRAIVGTPQSCQDSLRVSVSRDFQPGNAIVVTSTCRYGLSDIGFPGAPGSMTSRATFTSMLDPNRGVG